MAHKGTVRVEDGVLVSAVRYALGRRTYVVNETIKAVKDNINLITPKMLAVISKDIEDARSLGDATDKRFWLELKAQIDKHLNRDTK